MLGVLQSCSLTPQYKEKQMNPYTTTYPKVQKAFYERCLRESQNLRTADPHWIYSLGYCYSMGRGVEANPQLGYQLVSIAAQRGHVDAKKAIFDSQEKRKQGIPAGLHFNFNT